MPVRPLALCRHCGTLFWASVPLPAGTTTTLIDVTVDCPACLRDAQLLDGAYEAISDVHLVVRAFSLEQLGALRSVLDRVVAGGLDESTATQEIAAAAPQALGIWERLKGRIGTIAAAATLLIAAVDATINYIDHRSSPSIADFERWNDQLVTAVEQLQQPRRETTAPLERPVPGRSEAEGSRSQQAVPVRIA
jgi:hypothetical protein